MTIPPSGEVRTLFANLRGRNPKRALTYGEAIQVARRQAEYIRRWSVELMPAPDDLAVNLAWLTTQTVVPVAFAPSYMLKEESGLTTDRIDRQLRVFVNRNEPRRRQRFSLLHEMKHAIDFYDADILYAKLGQDDQELRLRLIERLADEFAAYVLMPTMQVRREWFACQNLRTLAKSFDVSLEAMNTRLEKLGLTGDRTLGTHTYFRRAARLDDFPFDPALLATA